MKFNKKQITAVILAAALCTGGLAGCGTKKKQTSSDGKIKITVANWPSEDGNEKAFENAENKRKEFEKKYKNIEVAGETWGYDQSTFMARAEGGSLSTVYTSFFTEAKKIIQFGYAADITDYVKKYGYYGKINETLLDTISKEESIYLLPKSAYSLGIVINMNLFREAGLLESDGTPKIPKTFDELAAFAQTVHEKTGKAGFVFPTTSNQGGWNFSMLAWSFGTEFIKKKDGKYTSNFANDKCAAALEYLKDLKWNKNALPSNTNVDAVEVVKLIGTDQAAMAIVHPGQLDALVKDYGMKPENIAMITMPAGPERHVTLMGGDFYVIEPNASPEQIDAAFKWIQFSGLTTEMDEDTKKRYENDKKLDFEENMKVIGVKDLSIWNDNADTEKFKNEVIEKYRNIPEKNVADYNNNKGSIEYQVEEEVCAQDLYATLDSCIQEVLTNKNSDVKGILKKAAADFQSNFLDYEN